MRLRRLLICYVIAFYCLAGSCMAQLWSGVLNPLNPGSKGEKQSAIDWSSAGVPGGIPSAGWTQCGPTLQASAFGNGTIDATVAINSALAFCGSNQFVLLSSGTFRVNSAAAGSPIIKIAKNETALRGSGASQTVLVSTGTTGGGIVQVGSWHDPGTTYGTNKPVTNAVNITSGATAGSQTITVSSATYFAVGGNMVIQELNDPAYVTINGGSGACTYCDGFWNGAYARGQIVHVTSVSGNIIGFTPPLYTAYTLTPQALPFMPVLYAGVENLQIYSENTHTANSNAPVWFYSCFACWARGIEENYTDGDYVKIFWGLHDEVRDSYFSNGYNHGPGQNNDTVLLGFKTSASKVENNIFERSENAGMLVEGAAGNVFAYNYATGLLGVPSTITSSFELHGAHVQFTLLEGNVFPSEWLDVGHGSNSQTTSFRNWEEGTSYVCSPTDGSRGTVSCSSGAWSNQASRAIAIDSLSSYNNLIGDVVGSSMQSALSGTKQAVIYWPQKSSYTGAYGLSFGYTLYSDNGTNSMDSTTPANTVFIHGLYNNLDGSTTWAKGITQSLPASFYLSGRPVWWRASLPFPAIGPDVSTTTGPVGHAGLIPAQWCYLKVMGGSEGGAGGPLTFNASACYGPQPPTGLTGTVR